jgi:hypothetical protein
MVSGGRRHSEGSGSETQGLGACRRVLEFGDVGPVNLAYNPYFFSLFFQSKQYFSLTTNQPIMLCSRLISTAKRGRDFCHDLLRQSQRDFTSLFPTHPHFINSAEEFHPRETLIISFFINMVRHQHN